MTQTITNPAVWGPPFWFVLHTICMHYPDHPNAITKKKYYELFQNLPLFLPVESMGNQFATLLDEFPVSSYLDSKDSLVKWMHFIHNKINTRLEKPTITLNDYLQQYYDKFKTEHNKHLEFARWKQQVLFVVVVATCIGIGVYFYDK